MIYDGILATAINTATFITAMLTTANSRLSPTDITFLTNFKVQLDASLNTTAQQDMIFLRIFNEFYLLHAAAKANWGSSTSIVAQTVTDGGA